MKRAAVAVAALLSAAPAHAQSVCMPLVGLLEMLQVNHGELVVATGEAGSTKVFIAVSPAGGFSIVIARGDVGCIVVAGRKLEFDRGT